MHICTGYVFYFIWEDFLEASFDADIPSTLLASISYRHYIVPVPEELPWAPVYFQTQLFNVCHHFLYQN